MERASVGGYSIVFVPCRLADFVDRSKLNSLFRRVTNFAPDQLIRRAI